MEQERVRPATLMDVARRSGFSKSVVSRALLGQPGVRAETAETIREVAKSMHYQPNPSAQALVGARTATLGLVLRDPSSAYYAELAREIHTRADSASYRVISVSHGPGDGGFDSALRHLIQLQLDGLIVSSSVVAPERIAAVSKQIPTVVVGRGHLDDKSVASVALARAASRELVDAAAASGHSHIGLLHHEQVSSPTQYERNIATTEYAESLGLRVSRQTVSSPPTSRELDAVVDAGASLVLCASDPLALTLLVRLEERGLSVPSQVGVVGFDGIGAYAHPYLGLASYRLPIEEMARESVRLLLELMSDAAPTGPLQVEVSGRVVAGRTANLHVTTQG